MLRVGLTGGLASGKSSVGLVFAEAGAHLFSSDDLARSLMQPGEPVYERIVQHFGTHVVAADGQLDRRALAEEAFQRNRLAELNAIVHPAVFLAQEAAVAKIAEIDPHAIVVIESALIFEVTREPAPGTAANWRRRFDRLVLVTAPDELKIARYLARTAPPHADQQVREQLARDARARLASQIPDAEKAPFCDYIIENTATLVLLRRKAQAVFSALRQSQS